MIEIVIVTDSDIGPKTSRKSRAKIGQTLASIYEKSLLKARCRESTSDKYKLNNNPPWKRKFVDMLG